jgi:uncharacterized damage-inducible protein DinB
MRKFTVVTALTAALACAAFAEIDIKATIVKHLKISRDFTLKVAEQMPEADYSFKLTPAQMSFGEQMVHLASSGEYFISPILGTKPKEAKPASMKKADVIAFVKTSFDATIEKVSTLTPAQLSKTYQGEGGTETGFELLLGLLDHTTHHRASAEMYLRAKGITPAEYQF